MNAHREFFERFAWRVVVWCHGCRQRVAIDVIGAREHVAESLARGVKSCPNCERVRDAGFDSQGR